MQNGNTSFNYDMLDIMSYRDVYALTDIHTTLTGLDTTIQYRDNFVSYYYDTMIILDMKKETGHIIMMVMILVMSLKAQTVIEEI